MTGTNDIKLKKDYRQRVASRMSTAVVPGIAMGGAIGKIALGLAIGLIVGGIGTILMSSTATGQGEK